MNVPTLSPEAIAALTEAHNSANAAVSALLETIPQGYDEHADQMRRVLSQYLVAANQSIVDGISAMDENHRLRNRLSAWEN